MASDALHTVETQVAQITAPAEPLRIDLSGVEALDTSGALVVLNLQKRLAADGAEVTISGANPAQTALLETVAEAMPQDADDGAPPRGLRPFVEGIGAGTLGALKGFGSLLSFFGATLHRLFGLMLRPWRLRWASLFSHMEDAGFNAVPIVILMSFLIGVVLAFQGSAQLRQFGAEVFVVDLIAISMLRELGILLTAIIVAGRSGSSFTASVGSMKVREEIDAMRTLGLDPIEVLVIPRVLALLFMLPVLGFVANVAGLLGGALMSWIELGVSPGMFITRLNENTSIWHLGISMIKAPFFALVIGVVACWQAMQVEGSSDSVGRQTTKSVVQSIFLVIVVDALFSIFFAQMGV